MAGTDVTKNRFDLDPPARQRVDRLGLEFLADFLGTQVERRPSDVDALIDLGHVLTQLGRFAEGLSIDRRLVRLLPEEPTVRYNLACSLALTGERERALDCLAQAIDLGYDDAGFLRDDEDFKGLRGDPRFEALLARLESAAS